MCRMTLSLVGGGSLVVTLVVLAAMSLAAVTLVTLVDTGLKVAGNAAFREAAVLASDAGTEAALAWLGSQSVLGTLLDDQPGSGYYASVPDGLLITSAAAGAGALASGIDWDDDQCAGRQLTRCLRAAPALPVDGGGHRVRFTIHRLCRTAGMPQAAGNSCLSWLSAGGGSRGQLSYGAALHVQPGERIYYRVTTRVRGPRNTTVFTQTLVHF